MLGGTCFDNSACSGRQELEHWRSLCVCVDRGGGWIEQRSGRTDFCYVGGVVSRHRMSCERCDGCGCWAELCGHDKSYVHA